MKGLPTLIVAVVTVVVLFVLAWKHGRTYCNTICPVGTVLGFLSKYSLFRPVIDTSKCKNCQLCAKKCKAACINLEKHEIDYSRCVACMDCISTCKHGALHYESRFKQKDGKRNEAPVQPDNSRRSFLTVAATVTVGATLKAQERRLTAVWLPLSISRFRTVRPRFFRREPRVPSILPSIVPPASCAYRLVRIRCFVPRRT